MSEHHHREYVDGCFRCDLSRDEVGHDPVLVVSLDGLEETIAREVASWSDPRDWEHMPPDAQAHYLDQGRHVVQALHGAGDETRGNGWAPDTCTTPHCICRRGHPNSPVIADTRSDGTPWEDTNP